ncbi:hypothetical protein SPSYN_00073 [Sporotomaculum syntrophicum]|uniref:Uncharacterized protein n=1 Tax=Sporotomaculum syntrophicum TaxID=182264 RepID=A0A9D2WRQ3_9FIRM|nr:hypothetical protein [Sporotomaculum syntrophicum]KAF1086355.1 hypothetical protein SPSYN_00073 [Sporotomaculum syntrophicum]
MDNKSTFKGTIISIQPRIRLTRSFDEASHTYLGYAIKIAGTIDAEETNFSIGIGKAAQAKFNFKVNDVISGECLPVLDPDMEPVDYYKVSKLAKVSVGEQGSLSAPWELAPPELEVYRERGHRRLAARTYDSKCSSCMWGARMPVEIIVDNWNPRGRRKHRFETFCYGPLSCKLYKAGPNRKVEGRNGMVYVEEDWVDEANVAHRGMEE